MFKITLKVDGMMCSMCESHVNDAIRSNFKVKSVKSSRKNGEAVIHCEEELDVEKLSSVLSSLGYSMLSQNTEQLPDGKKHRFLFGKNT